MLRSQRLVSVIGVLFVAIAAGQAALKLAGGGAVSEAAIDFVLMSLPGALLVYVGRWASNARLDSDLTPRVAGWCLGGVGVMLVFLVLRAAHPGVTTSFSFGTRAIALAIGSVAGLGIGIHDARAITREREIERRNAELERTREQLEQRNDELRRAQADLEDAVSRLEDSNRQLDHFASVASHDLREPLRMVASYLSLLEERYGDDLDADGREFLAFAVDGAERMQRLVAGLLEYARVETGGDPCEPIDLEAVLEDVLTDLQVRIDETDAEITADGLPTIRGDASQLRQLFQNLLGNAIEYADGPPRVHVSARERDAATASNDEREWEIAVRDEGIGIAPDDRDRIFELFDRLHDRAERDGTGIGLALCRRIVERHGGEIRVESEPGEGSTFFVALPRPEPDGAVRE